ncbi:MAG: nucleotidyltransferase domain-containing protein [Nitrospira sp.]|nr:nucleotidyltransferase domain-containing protein [Nitrospira sp.]
MQREYEPLMPELLRLLREEFGDRVRSLLVFGSVARGTARPDSDVDVCVVIRGLPVSRYQRHQLLGPVLERLRQSAGYEELIRRGYTPDVAAVLYTPEEFQETKPIFLDLVEEGILLHDDGTARAKLDQLRARMKTLGSRKIVLDDGSYYWLLKPGLRFGEVIEL